MSDRPRQSPGSSGGSADNVNQALFWYSFGNFAVASGAFLIPGILAPLSEGLGISVVEAGYLMTVYAAAYAIGSPVLTALTAAWGRRTLLLTGLGVLGGATLLTALAPGPVVAFGSRVIAALGAAIYTPVVSYIVAVTSPPERRGRNMSLAYLGLSVSQVLGIPLGTYIGFTFGWRAGFAMVAVLAALAWLMLYRAAPRGIRGQAMGGAAWKALGRDWRLLLAISVTALQFAGQFVLYTYIGPYLAEATHLDTAGITAALVAFGAASIVGGLAGGWMSDRFGAYRSILACLLLMALGLGLMSVAPESVWVTMGGMALWSVFGFAYTPPQQARLIALGAQTQAMSLALNASCVYVGSALGAIIGGAMIVRSGYAWLGIGGAALCLLSVAALWLSRSNAVDRT